MPSDRFDLDRRDALKLTIAAAAFGAGAWSVREDTPDPVGTIGGIGGDSDPSFSEVSEDGTLVWASDYDAMQTAAGSAAVLGVTAHGTIWRLGEGVVEVADLVIKTGADTLAEARDLVDQYPTLVVTATGNAWTFTEGR
jgi:hypothetical protein